MPKKAASRSVAALKRTLRHKQEEMAKLQQECDAIQAEIADRSQRELSRSGSRDPVSEPTTPREWEVLLRVAQGLTNAQVAAELGIGGRTVETHRARGMHKLNLASVADLVRYVDHTVLANESRAERPTGSSSRGESRPKRKPKKRPKNSRKLMDVIADVLGKSRRPMRAAEIAAAALAAGYKTNSKSFTHQVRTTISRKKQLDRVEEGLYQLNTPARK